MTDYQKWLDRIDNLLQVQRDRCLDLISANFTRRELIELKMMIEVLMEIKLKQDDWNEPENPPSDDRLVLVSFANYPVPGIARYIGDEENGGAYYTDESDRSLSSHGFIVNGWMELPKCRED